MPNLNDLLAAVKRLPLEDKRAVLRQLVHDAASSANQDLAICDAGGVALAYLVPAARYCPLESSQLLAEVKERMATPAPTCTTADLLARLHALNR